jgi:hypothetical protein
MLQEIEPDTYNKLEQRIQGVHAGALYAQDDYLYSVKKLPPAFKTWRDYRIFLYDNLHDELKVMFTDMMIRLQDSGQEHVERHMCKRLLLCDWEFNIADPKTFYKQTEQGSENMYNFTKEHLQITKDLRNNNEVYRKWKNIL